MCIIKFYSNAEWRSASNPDWYGDVVEINGIFCVGLFTNNVTHAATTQTKFFSQSATNIDTKQDLLDSTADTSNNKAVSLTG